ncbi:MAG: ABC transporter ATP-binding protein [Clostridia bacterium]
MINSHRRVLIQANDVSVRFETHQGFLRDLFSKQKRTVSALDGIDLSIYDGEIFSLVGESGSGKTTLGKTLLQLVKPTEGSVTFAGEEIRRQDLRAFRKKAQMIFQDPYQSLNPKDLIFDIVAEPLRVHDMAGSEANLQERVVQALEWAGLKPGEQFLYRYPHELSGGQRQRVVIAAALILNPSFIVADEPVSMLDVSVRADILKLMVKLRDERSISYLFITHDLSLAWLISDRVAIMYLGKIVEIGSAELIAGGGLHPYTQALVSVMPTPEKRMNRKRTILKGETPDPGNAPGGCRFHPRCPVATDRCRTESPRLVEVEPEHYVSCHLV